MPLSHKQVRIVSGINRGRVLRAFELGLLALNTLLLLVYCEKLRIRHNSRLVQDLS